MTPELKRRLRWPPDWSISRCSGLGLSCIVDFIEMSPIPAKEPTMYPMLNQAIAAERSRALRTASEASRLARQARRVSKRTARERAHEAPVRAPSIMVTAAS